MSAVFYLRLTDTEGWRESQANQGLLPGLGERAVVAIATAKHNAGELGNDSECVFQNLWAGVVAIY